MSYEKYIKYKTKYLNLKTKIHNERIQSGGGNKIFTENDFIQTLGSTPNSEIFNKNINLVGGAKTKKSNIYEKSSSSQSNSSSHNNLLSNKSSFSSYNLPNKLSSSRSSENNNSDKSLKSTDSKDLNNETFIGGARKLKKNKNVFSESDSELDDTESSLLSFSSVDSTDSSFN
jgi:hypothetical protein